MIPQATPLFAVFEGSPYVELVIGWVPGSFFKESGDMVPITIELGEMAHCTEYVTEWPFRLFTSEEAANAWLLSQ